MNHAARHQIKDDCERDEAMASDHDRLAALCRREPYTPIPRCGLCDRMFVSVRQWERHLRTSHPVVKVIEEGLP